MAWAPGPKRGRLYNEPASRRKRVVDRHLPRRAWPTGRGRSRRADSGEPVSDRFTDQLWREAEPVWQAIREHPFLRDLRAGTLPIETFRYYVIQDYHYLEAFGRSVATALAKAPTSELLTMVARRVNTPIERPLHERLFALAGLT